jgi:uncharacterized protein YjbJ (UPF0337 family)
MNKNQVDGKISEIKGGIKEITGKAVGNPTLEVKGKVEKIAGKIQGKIGNLAEDIKNKL